MASWLVIDWDQDHFHLLCANSTRRGVEVTRAASWPHPEPFTPSTAERVGKALRDFLKDQRLSAAPVIFGVGRDRVFLKELRFPEIAPHEEANLVRFQTGKELTESVEHFAVDYVHLNREGAGDRHVMTVAMRRDVVTMIQTLCQAAGLKVHAITPKVFGTVNAVERAVYPDETPMLPKTLSAVLTVGQRWAELCFFRGRRLLQAQSLANGPMLVGEIKRNVAVFQAQHAVDVELTGPDCLFMFGDHSGGVQSAQNGHQLPIRMLNPLKQEPDVSSRVKNPSCFAGAVGLAEIWSMSGPKPINLAAPRRLSAPVSVTRQRGMFYGAVAAVFACVMIGMMWYVLNAKKNELKELTEDKNRNEEVLRIFAQERADIDAYKDWEQTSIDWLDEFYDLSARHPWEIDFRVNQLTASTTGTKKTVKDGYVGKMKLMGYAPAGKQVYVKSLNESMARDGHVRAQVTTSKDGSKYHEYQMKIDLAKQDPRKYEVRLIVPPAQLTPITPEPQVEAKTPDAMPDTDPDPDPDPDGDAKEGEDRK